MSRISSFFAGMVVGAAVLFIAMQFYIVRSKDGINFIPKLAAKLEMPYVDIRKFTLSDWQNRQPLAVAIMKANRGNLMQDSTLSGFKQAAQNALDQISGDKTKWGW
ncbi:MAG: hypothetical protein SGI77_25775 [Pirellulaceae bacterium]|nr:hypothetical protein [Pirellulaceae bacterium]